LARVLLQNSKHSAMLAPGVLLVCFTVKKTVPVLLEDKY